MAKKFIETRKRGIIGWVMSIIFWVFNIFMIIWMVAAINVVSDTSKISSEAEQLGHNIGSGAGLMIIVIVWVAGVIILGALSFFTRGRKEMIEVDV